MKEHNSQNAPIALFVYNRLWHTQQTVSALQSNFLASESELFIFSDGPKNISNEPQVHAVRQWIKTISGFKKISIIEQPYNLGLAQSIINGVSNIVKKYGKIIVLEDDLIVTKHFLQYMNDGLRLYENEPTVASIHGYALPLAQEMPETYFLRGADCWGWATWQRAWSNFEPNGKKLLKILKKNGSQEFDFSGTQPNIQMLKDQIKGKNNSWAIRWHASAFIKGMLTLHPKHSLVQNIGLDNTGEHCITTNLFDVKLNEKPITVVKIPIEKCDDAYQAHVDFFKCASLPVHRKIMKKIRYFYTFLSKMNPLNSTSLAPK